MQKHEKKRKYMRRSLLGACSLFALCLSIVVGFVGFVTHCKGTADKQKEYISGILNITRTEVDGDDIQECIASTEISEKYRYEQEYLNKVRDSFDIESICIIKPLNYDEKDNMMYIMAGQNENEREEGKTVALGELSGEEYRPKTVTRYMDVMENKSGIVYYANKTQFGYIYTGLAPVMNQKGDAVAVLAVSVSMNQAEKTVKVYLKSVWIETILLTVLFMIALYQWLKKRIINPVRNIEIAAENFVKDSHRGVEPEKLQFVKPDIPAKDEMESLCEAICAMSEDLKSYMTNLLKETQDKERIASELNVATQIQTNMLPSIFPAFPGRKEFDVYANMTPAKEVGGDFYDYFLTDDNHVALVIADVSGKGVPAALFMVIAKTLIKNRTLMGGSPKEILEFVNRQLCENNKVGMFVTVWLGIMEISTGKITAVNAGHEYPVVKTAEGQFELLKDKHGLVLAGMDEIKYKEYEFQLEKGGSLYVYTDGVPEATNAQSQMFTTDRMLAALNKEPHSKMDRLLYNVKKEIDDFVEDAPQFDDITMLVLHYYGERGEEE